MKPLTPISQVLTHVLNQKAPPISGRIVSAKSSRNIPDRRKIIGQEIIKLYTALSLDLVADIIDAKVALAVEDWAEVPTNWLRRTCARARKQCEWLPKTSEILSIYKSLRTLRRKRREALDKCRVARRPVLDEGPMTEATRVAFMRETYKRMGMDYDREKKKDALILELKTLRKTRRMETA